MPDREYLGRWRSKRAEERFRAMEDALWRESTTHSPQAIDVDTRFGPTRAYHWAGDGDPILFLHGVSGTSLVWTGYADALLTRNVYALDIMGDAGRSQHQVAYETSSDLAVWLDEALAGLGLDSVHLVGHSLGGYVALTTAINRPARIQSLVLFDPVGISKLSMVKFMLWGLPILFGSLAPAFIRRWLARRFRMPLLENRAAMRLGLHSNLHHPPRFPPFELFTDDVLRSISVPVRLLVGEKTEMFNGEHIVRRARDLIPSTRADLVPNAGHALTVSHLDACVTAIDQATHRPASETD